MAIRKNTVFEQVSGKIGDTITRYRYGKYVTYKKPELINYSQSTKAINARTKFGYTVKFARLINSVPELKCAWKSVKIKGVNPYQRIIKHNAKFTSVVGLTTKNIITPPGIDCFKYSIVIDKSEILVSSVLDTDYLKPPYKIHVLLFCFDEKENAMHFVNSNDVLLKEKNILEGRISLDEGIKKEVSNSKNILLLCAFTSSTKKTFWSSTFSSELK